MLPLQQVSRILAPSLDMAGTLVFHTFKSIFSHAERLREQVSAIECAKERRAQMRKLRRKPIVRMCLIIESAAGYKCGTLQNLTEDERSLMYALDTVSNFKFVLGEFRRLVLQPARKAAAFQRWWSKMNNQSKQHPDFNPERLRREFLFAGSESYLDMGKTYYSEMLMLLFDDHDADGSFGGTVI